MKTFEEIINNYLTNLANEDECFAAKFNNPNKTVQECCNYIFSEVKKQSEGKSAVGMSDEEVYYLARHYYEEENVKIDLSSVTSITHVADKKPNKAEKPKKESIKKKEKNTDQLSLFDFINEEAK